MVIRGCEFANSHTSSHNNEGAPKGEERISRIHAGGRVRLEKFNIISSTRPEFYDPHIWVNQDIDHRTRIHLINLLRDMERSRNSNAALEESKKKREAPTPSPPSKKRITATTVMAEQEMFQEEHLKLLERVGRMEARLNKTIRVLAALQARFEEHVSLDSNGATPVASITLSAGSQNEDGSNQSSKKLPRTCLACNKSEDVCKCFDE